MPTGSGGGGRGLGRPVVALGAADPHEPELVELAAVGAHEHADAALDRGAVGQVQLL